MFRKSKFIYLLLVFTIILSFSLSGCKKDELKTVKLI